jgi:hypothetical protein
MEKDPEKRYSSAAALRADLESLIVQNPLTAPAPRWAYGVSAVALLLSTASLWWSLTTPPQPTAAAAHPATVEQAVRVLITGREVAILDFENRTGDPELDAFGRLTGEAIATALAARGLPVVSATAASAADGITVAGFYTLAAGEVRFDARLLSARRGTVVHHVQPVSAPRAALQVAANTSQRYVVDAIVNALDTP